MKSLKINEIKNKMQELYQDKSNFHAEYYKLYRALHVLADFGLLDQEGIEKIDDYDTDLFMTDGIIKLH